MSRTTVLPVIAPFSSSETSTTTTPSAILWTGYGMSPADTTSAGLNEACAKLRIAQEAKRNVTSPTPMEILCIPNLPAHLLMPPYWTLYARDEQFLAPL